MRKLVTLAVPAILALSACSADPYNTGDVTVYHHHHYVSHHTVTHHVITHKRRTVTIKPARPRFSLTKKR